MVRRAPDGQEGSGSGGEAAGNEGVTTTGLPPFTEVFVPQFEAIESVLERLTGFALLPIEVPSRDVAAVLGQWLSVRGRRTHFVFEDAPWRRLTASIMESPPGAGSIVTVIQPSRMFAGEMARALRLLNQRRDTIVTRLGTPLLWCGDRDFLAKTAELAPDFWSVRELPLEIHVPAEYATWQGTWKILIENPTWQFSNLGSPHREHMMRQYGPDGLFQHSDPERLKSDARFVLDLAQERDVSPDLIRTALAILRAADDQTNVAIGMEIAAKKAWEQEDSHEAERLFREARSLFKQLANDAGLLRTTLELADVVRLAGRFSEAEEMLQEVFPTASAVGDWGQEADVLLSLAAAQREGGRLDKAKLSIDQARVRLEGFGDAIRTGRMHIVLAMTLADSADFDAADQEMQTALDVLESSNHPDEALAAMLFGVMLRASRGDGQGALALLRRAVASPALPSSAFMMDKVAETIRRLPTLPEAERDTLLAAIHTQRPAPTD